MDTLKPQTNGPFIQQCGDGTLAVDGWAVTSSTARKGPSWAGCGPSSSLLAVPNVTAYPSMASVPTSYYSM